MRQNLPVIFLDQSIHSANKNNQRYIVDDITLWALLWFVEKTLDCKLGFMYITLSNIDII